MGVVTKLLHAATETKDRGSIDKDLHSTTEAEGEG